MNANKPRNTSKPSPTAVWSLAGLLSGILSVGLYASPASAPDSEGTEIPSMEENAGEDMAAPETSAADENVQEEPASGEDAASLAAPAPSVAQRGHWGATGSIAVRSFYDSNIFIQSSHPQSDWISQVEPSIHLGLGDYLTKAENYLAADYTARQSLFIDHTNQDALGHDLLLSGLQQMSRLSGEFGLHLKTAEEPDADAGRRTRSEIYEGTFVARYELTARTALESDFLARQTSYDGLLSSTEVKATEWLVYQATQRIDQSLGVTYGDLWPSEGARQTYEQLLSRTRFLQSAIITAGLTAGVERRSYQDNSRTTVSPVLALTVDYNTHAGSSFHLEAFRRIENSNLFTNENRTETGLQGSAVQKLTRNWSVGFAGSVGTSEYSSTNDSVDSDRSDLFFALTPSLLYEPNEHWSASIFTQFQKNDSSQNNFRYRDFQVGFAVKTTF